jgi:pimeloyl-ACP methyl ester carboxylesterase
MHRRAVLAAAVPAAVAATSAHPAVAAQQGGNASLADHPLAGAWLAMANPPNPADPPFAAPSFFYADGTVLLVFPPIQAGPQGVAFQSDMGGTWEAAGERTGHFTVVQALAGSDGAYLGTVTVDGHPEVSADGTSFVDADPRSTVTVRDPAGAVVMQAPAVGDRPVTAIRMAPGAPGFPQAAGSPAMATPAAAAENIEGEFANINGADLYYEVHGPADGPPVLLLHGGLGNTEEFDGLLPALLAAGFRTVAMDCRGRGRSTWGDDPITYEQMAADAVGLLDLLGIAKTDLVGWSDGAIIGLLMGFTYPERLNRVVAYGANFTPDGFHEPTPSDQLPPFEKFVDDYRRLSPEPERFEELLAATSALYAVAPSFSETQLGSIPVPVLILDGAEEEMIDPDQPIRMAELIPGSEMVIMPGTGHFAPTAQPDEFNRIVLDFLQG